MPECDGLEATRLKWTPSFGQCGSDFEVECVMPMMLPLEAESIGSSNAGLAETRGC